MSKSKKLNRREFTRIAAGSTAALGLASKGLGAEAKKTKIPMLKPGSKIGLVAPATRVKEDLLERAKQNMKSLGFEIFHRADVTERWGSFAGTDQRRLDELHQMYRDKSVDAIWAIGGGYGTTRFNDRLDFRMIRRNHKPLIGYSDITGLLNTIQRRTGSPCIHGPVAGGGALANEYARRALTLLTGAERPFVINLPNENKERAKKDSAYEYYEIKSGTARGKLVGGNLSLLAAMVGTQHLPKTKGGLVFIEDIGEKPYRIDRMLTTLISSGFFKGAKGVIFGVSVGCDNDPDDEISFSLREVITERIGKLGIPAAYGFPVGHVRDNCFLPIKALAEMDTKKGTISIL